MIQKNLIPLIYENRNYFLANPIVFSNSKIDFLFINAVVGFKLFFYRTKNVDCSLTSLKSTIRSAKDLEIQSLIVFGNIPMLAGVLLSQTIVIFIVLHSSDPEQ